HRKTLALLALLAAAGKNGLSRDKVMAYLWPERDTEHARALLKQACYALRRDLHTHELFRGATELRLNQDVLASDVQAFEDALQRSDLEAAPDPAVTDFARRLREVSEQRARTVAAGEVTRERVVPNARLPEAPTRSGAATRALRRAFRVASWPAVVAALTAVVGGVLYSRFKKVAALDPDL